MTLIQTLSSIDQTMIEEKELCKDKKSKKKCQQLKNKNNGKGCKKKATKKNCKKTCGLCDDGKSFLTQVSLDAYTLQSFAVKVQ